MFLMMTTMVLLFIFRFGNLHAYIREVRPEHGRYRVQRKANYGAIRPTSNIVSWQRTARVWTESWAPCRQLNPCEKHGPGLSREHHADNSIQPTSGHNSY